MYEDKLEIMKKKKALRHSKIFICEDLTKSRLNILNEARNKFGKVKVWTTNGKFFAI